MSKIIFVLGLFVASAIAYDFSDSAFNEGLLTSLSFDGNSQLRLKRETEPEPTKECKEKKHNHYKCCSDEPGYDSSKHFEEFHKHKEECLEELFGNSSYFSFDPFNCEKIEELKSQMVCLSECVARKIGMLDEDGDVDPELLLKCLTEKSEGSQWKSKIAKDVAAKCSKEDEEETAEKSESDSASDDKKKCNPSALKAMHCVWSEFVLACPKEQQIDSFKCKKIREKLEKGETSPFKGAFHRFHHHHNHH